MRNLSILACGMLVLLLAESRPALARSHPASVHQEAERVRIQRHLAEVESELLAADVSHLSATERARRAQHVIELRAYREAGRFPINRDFPDRPMPYFRDADGTLCAMAHLIEASGHGEAVDRVARARNNAFIHELADDPEIVGWLRDNGLSVDEAARIQPSYRPVDRPKSYCICDQGWSAPLAEGEVVMYEHIEATVRIDVLHPAGPLVYEIAGDEPGERVEVVLVEGDYAEARVDDTFVYRHPEGTPVIAGHGWTGRSPFMIFHVPSDDGLIRCDTGHHDDLAVSPETAGAALASDDCHAVLEAEDARWAETMRCDGDIYPPQNCRPKVLGCSTAVAGSGGAIRPGTDPAFAAWALLLLGGLVARRKPARPRTLARPDETD